MVTSLFSGNGAGPSVRRPLLEVSFGSGSSEDWRQAVVSLTVTCALAPSVDSVEIWLSAGSTVPAAATEDTGSVSLGYEDSSTETVFTGKVEAVQHTVQGLTRVTSTNGGATLSKLRVNQSYDNQAAGDIVSDLATKAGVGTDVIESGMDLSFYVIDDRRSVYGHVAALAKKCGYLAYFTPDGDLKFAPFSAGQPVAVFTYGVEILSLWVTETVPAVGTVTTIGEGAAGSQGKEAWSWLVKDPSSVTGRSGTGDPKRSLDDPSLRNGDAAQGAAEGIAAAAGLMTVTGRLAIPGTPAAAVGSAVEIAGAPQDALNGLCLVRQVKHRFTKRTGFTTLIVFSKAGEGGLRSSGGLL